MSRIFVYLFSVSVFAFGVDSARILGIFPMPSISHQVVFRALTMELAKRGHELVVVTTDPALPKERPPDNITEIDVSFAYDKLRESYKHNRQYFERGTIVRAKLNLNPEAYQVVIEIYADIIDHPEVKKIMTDENQHFDLIIAEAFMNYHLIVSKFFNAPMILFSSFHGVPEYFEAIGAVTRHPIFYPTPFSDSFEGVSIIEKFNQAKFEYGSYNSFKQIEYTEDRYLKQRFGPKAPTSAELKNNIDMLFINSNPIFCNNRPLPPNAIYVGPLHLNPLKELPQDMKDYLDKSKNGVIYVSLGTNVNPADMDPDLREAFVEAFRELPSYDILWKFNGEIDNLPTNVKIQKWFPQRDLLAHPNVKLFVTQGGLQSADEAIDAGVPLVGIPMLGDQYYNVHKYVQLGIGVKVDALTLDKDSLLAGIKEVLADDRFKKNMQKLKNIMNDQPQPPLERAVWWTEYVIRHGGAKHLRAPTANISWAEFLMADVVAAVLAVVVLALTVVYLALRFVIAKVFGRGKLKTA